MGRGSGCQGCRNEQHTARIGEAETKVQVSSFLSHERIPRLTITAGWRSGGLCCGWFGYQSHQLSSDPFIIISKPFRYGGERRRQPEQADEFARSRAVDIDHHTSVRAAMKRATSTWTWRRRGCVAQGLAEALPDPKVQTSSRCSTRADSAWSRSCSASHCGWHVGALVDGFSLRTVSQHSVSSLSS